MRIIGNEAVERLFVSSFLAKKCSHAWLFSGTNGIGKKLIAKHIASWILSGNFDVVPRDIEIINHPDLMVIEEEGQIKVDLIRDVIHFLNLKPVNSTHKVVIIDNVDNINVNAVNALLKSIEEPPAGSIILLISSQYNALPVTILSRCSMLRFVPLHSADVKEILTKKYAELSDIDSWLEISNSPGLLFYMIQEDAIKMYEKILRCFTQELSIISLIDSILKSNRSIFLFTYLVNLVVIRIIKYKVGAISSTILFDELDYLSKLNSCYIDSDLENILAALSDIDSKNNLTLDIRAIVLSVFNLLEKTKM